MEKLRLFVGASCPYCEVVKRFIKQNDIEGIELVNINEDQEAREYLLEKGGKQQIPCLFIGEEPLYESSDIVNYLKENFIK
ncbi:MAG: glutaredoxin [Gallicola sp.]|nr:glutaredoxin [Gallicola sp.]